MKLRWVLAIVFSFLAFLFRKELRKQSGFIALYYENCYPEKYPGTCSTIAELAKMQYEAWEGAVVGVAQWITNPKRLVDWSPVAIGIVGAIWAIRRFRGKGATLDLDQDVLTWWFD